MAMSNEEKLLTLANWLDVKFPGQDDEVQQDLRKIAKELSDGRRAIDAMEKVFHGLIERHIEGECVNCDYILKICRDYEQAKQWC